MSQSNWNLKISPAELGACNAPSRSGGFRSSRSSSRSCSFSKIYNLISLIYYQNLMNTVHRALVLRFTLHLLCDLLCDLASSIAKSNAFVAKFFSVRFGCTSCPVFREMGPQNLDLRRTITFCNADKVRVLQSPKQTLNKSNIAYRTLNKIELLVKSTCYVWTNP